VKRTYTITIDDSVLLPSPRGEQSRILAHPLPSMLKKLAVGESFTWPEVAKTDWNNLRSIASKWGRSNGMKIATRQVKKRGGGFVLRFWRIQ
jgi:hypothetical protein